MSACDSQTWNGYQDTEVPLVIVPHLLRFQYNLTCLRDSGRWCNLVAAAAALAQDPGSKLLQVLLDREISFQTLPPLFIQAYPKQSL